MKRTIILLTDFGIKDYFAGHVKGVIAKFCKNPQIIDLSHEISSFNIEYASYLLFKSIEYFPKHSIFLSIVDPGVGSSRKIIAIKTKNHIFIALIMVYFHI